MLIMIHFRYKREVYSFLNKKATYIFTFLYLAILSSGLLQYFQEKSLSALLILISALGFLSVFTVAVALNTSKIKKKYQYFISDSIKVPGKIVDCEVCRGSSRSRYHFNIEIVGSNRSSGDPISSSKVRYYLIVEYICPDTLQTMRFKTPQVNGHPYVYLSALDVDVYIKNNETFATNFKWIRKYEDSVEYQERHRS